MGRMTCPRCATVARKYRDARAQNSGQFWTQVMILGVLGMPLRCSLS